MGGFLSRRHGRELVVAGFAFHEGRYTAVAAGAGLKANDARPSEPGSVEWAIHQAGLPRAILDLRAAAKGSPESAWLTAPIEHRSIGALATDLAFFPTMLPEQYDLLIAFDKTSPSRLLPQHRRD
jgi:erythromycin esterase-like protein